MKLLQVLDGVKCRVSVDKQNIDVASLACDTSSVRQGCLFFCLKGSRFDGHDFARKAVGDGAVALVVERLLDIAVPQIVVDDVRLAMALCAKNFYDKVADKMQLVFVVGTNGKTSTTYLLDAVFVAAGFKTGVIGTNGIFFDGVKHKSSLTTPDPIVLHKTLWQMYQSGVKTVFMEASAHAIALKKLVGLHAHTAVFTNFSQDHLDFFGNMNNYKAVKKSLFCSQYISNAVINVDDGVGREIVQNFDGAVTYSVDGVADVVAINVTIGKDGVVFDVDRFGNKAQVNMQLFGRYNVYNALAALSVASLFGIDLQTSVDAICKVDRIDGRGERFVTSSGVCVVVDFAHTPDGIDNVLRCLKQECCGRLYVVFGCGGNRDRFKRPLMSQAVSKYADFAVLTNDNPRNEHPVAIVKDAICGLTCPHKTILDRKQATAFALQLAKSGDTVAILGKGAETEQQFNGKSVYYNDMQTVYELTKGE